MYVETFRMEHLDANGNVTHVTEESATVVESADDLNDLFAMHGISVSNYTDDVDVSEFT